LTAFETLQDERALLTARRNLDHQIRQLWDGERQGFNDRPGVPGRVPNKLATLAECLIRCHELCGDEQYLYYAVRSLETVLAYQLPSGAVHQYGPGALSGDEKLFPFYNARCVPPLLRGAAATGARRYRDGALGIVSFLESAMRADGSWDQIVYRTGGRTASPRWLAGAADILRACACARKPVPELAMSRLLAAQLESGGFQTADGFARLGRRSGHGRLPVFQDVLPVAGWNDKVFRWLAEILPHGAAITPGAWTDANRPVVGGRYRETADAIELVAMDGTRLFFWRKRDPWTTCRLEALA
jgi:hypothetical protein